MQSVAIITIGDELLIGQVVDTNSAWIGRRMAESGLTVSDIHSVSDTEQAICEALDQTLGRFDVVITTGGLGPTKDDITKHTLARYFGLNMVRNESVFEHVRTLISERGVDFNSLNQSQADMPEGFEVLCNKVGTAPGMYFESRACHLFCLPGVPFEMKKLIDEQVLPIINKKLSLQNVIHHTVLVYGLPESELAVRIEDWESALPEYLKLAYLPNPRGIRLRLSAYGVDGERIGEQINALFEQLRELIPDCFLGDEPTSIEDQIALMLIDRHSSLSVAESCTGGTIAGRITAMQGASAYFKGAVVAYSNEAKINILGVDPILIAQHGAVSVPVVEQMAIGVQKSFGTEYSISTSGVAGPSGGSVSKPVGLVCVAVAGPSGVKSFTRNFGQPRAVCVERAGSFALNTLRLMLLGK